MKNLPGGAYEDFDLYEERRGTSINAISGQ